MKLSFIANLLPFSRYKIVGHSMEPTLKNGQVVWVNKWAYLWSAPRVGEVVVFRHQGKEFIKRIVKQETKKFLTAGDNSQDSLDSRRFGGITKKAVLGKVVI